MSLSKDEKANLDQYRNLNSISVRIHERLVPADRHTPRIYYLLTEFFSTHLLECCSLLEFMDGPHSQEWHCLRDLVIDDFPYDDEIREFRSENGECNSCEKTCLQIKAVERDGCDGMYWIRAGASRE
jgi:hypothetical protein